MNHLFENSLFFCGAKETKNIKKQPRFVKKMTLKFQRIIKNKVFNYNLNSVYFNDNFFKQNEMY